MDIFIYVSRFIYRIRYKLLFGSAIAVVLAVYFTSYLPIRYNVTTTIFTGITSQGTLNDLSEGADWNASTNAHDNIINLIKSKSTMERVSISLLAQHLIYGDPKKDNNYISAANYNKLMKIVPRDIMALIDKSSLDNTINNLIKYKKEDQGNFIYAILNWTHPHYSYSALQSIKVKRKENSDMIEISYQSNDRGITMNTIAFLNNELGLRYEELLLNTSNGVVKYFEDQLDAARKTLTTTEDSLVKFNTDHKIINYSEQTKYLAALNNTFETKYEEILLANQSSRALIKQLETQMDTRTSLMKENSTFLNTLSEISTLNGRIAEIEIFRQDTANNVILKGYKDQLKNAENKIRGITNNIDMYKYSKQGVAITDMVTQWLNEVIKQEKSRAELEVMLERRAEIDEQYKIYSPVGPNLNRKDREVRVAEESYLTLLNHLGLARLNQKNILLNSGTLQIVTPPELPLLAMPRKRDIYVIIALVMSIVFICGFYIIVDLLDRTIRDSERAQRLTSGNVLGVFPRNERLKYRGYNKAVQRMAISHLANSLNNYIKVGEPTVINLLSIEQREGKSYIAKQLMEHWENMGFSVRILSYHKDFDSEQKAFFQVSSLSDIISISDEGNKPEMIIIEYAALKQNSIPSVLLNEASVNLLITDAGRVWKSSDQPIFNKLRETVVDNPLFIYLNNGSREAVEEYTGQLPPYTKIRKITYRLFNLGLTSKST